MSSYKQQDINPKTLKINRLSFGRAWKVIGILLSAIKEVAEETTGRDTAYKQQFEKHLGPKGGTVTY